MLPLSSVVYIIFLHFIADFILQSERMGMNKYKDSKILTQHCSIYCLPFIFFGWKYSLLAGALHFPIDFITSRCTHTLYDKKQYHLFFVVIGFDQLIHMIILLKTYEILFL